MSRLRLSVIVTVALCASQFYAADARALTPDEVSVKLAAAQRALADWQLDDAAELAAELDRALPDIPAVQELVGEVRFHQGEYASSVKLLQRAAEGGAIPALMPLAQSTLAETKDAKRFESEHFYLRVPTGKDEILAEPALWALEKAFDEVSKAFDYRPDHKIVVDVLHDARGLAEVSTLTVKEIETSGTIALCKYNRLMITSPKALARGYGWLDTLAHEFIHLVISEKSHNTVPIWLHEGLAKYSESLWRGAPGLALHPASEKLLADAVKANKLITFDEMHPSMAKLPSQEATALAFAEVFTMIEFLHQQPTTSKTTSRAKKKRRKTKRMPAGGFAITNRLIDELATGAKMDAALRAAVGSPLSKTERKWKRYLKRRKFRLVPGAKRQQLTFVRDARTRSGRHEDANDEAALDEAKGRQSRRYVRLGNLLRRKGRVRGAIVEYEKAVAQIPGRSPMLQNRLAGLYVDQGELTRAEALLKQSLVAFPDDSHSHVLLGRVALRQKHWAESKRHYLRATWENPFIPEIYAALHKIGEAMSDGALVERGKTSLALLSGQHAGEMDVNRVEDGDPAGTITVASTPWGEVFLDGVSVGLSTPLIDWRVPPGAHRIRVGDPGTGKQATETIEVVEGENLRLTLRLDDVTPATLEQWQAQERTLAAKRRTDARSEADAVEEKADATAVALQSALEALDDDRPDDALAAAEQLRTEFLQVQSELAPRQEAWLAYIEVLARAKTGAVSIAGAQIPGDEILRELPAATHVKLLETGMALGVRRSRPDLVLPLAERCDKRARQARQLDLIMQCAQSAGNALVAMGEPALLEIVASRLLDAAKEVGNAPRILEAISFLTKNYSVTRSPTLKGRMLLEIPTVKSLVEGGAPGADVALSNLEALVGVE